MTATAERPSLLIIMPDEHAPQFSAAYGHPLVQTPHLDRLAEEGVLFEHTYCNSPICLDDPPELHDLEADPGELRDLAAVPDYREVVEELRARLLAGWDPIDLERWVRQSQWGRLLIHRAETEEAAGEVRRRWYSSGAAGARPT